MTHGFGIIGCGMIAKFHAKAIAELPDAQLVACYNRSLEKAEAFAEEFDCKAYADLDEMLADPEVTIVTIATPSGAHLEPTVAAAKAGKHVIVEKPLEITLERCDQMIAACEEAGVKLAAIFPSRFHYAPMELHKAVEAGRFGKLTLGDAYVKWYRTQEYYDSGAWRGTWELDGGGALMNQAIHSVDLLSWMMGPVKSIAAFTDTLGHENIEVEDVAVATLRFENGAVGVIEATTTAYPGYLKRIELHGTEGSAIVEEEDILKWDFTESAEADEAIKERMSAKGDSGGGASDPAAIGHHGHKELFAQVLESIDEDKPLALDGHEGRKAVEIILAIYKSAVTKSIVELPLKSSADINPFFAAQQDGAEGFEVAPSEEEAAEREDEAADFFASQAAEETDASHGDFGFEGGASSSGDESLADRARKRQPAKGSGMKQVLGVVGGGVAGILGGFIALVLIGWVMNKDYLEPVYDIFPQLEGLLGQTEQPLSGEQPEDDPQFVQPPPGQVVPPLSSLPDPTNDEPVVNIDPPDSTPEPPNTRNPLRGLGIKSEDPLSIDTMEERLAEFYEKLQLELFDPDAGFQENTKVTRPIYNLLSEVAESIALLNPEADPAELKEILKQMERKLQDFTKGRANLNNLARWGVERLESVDRPNTGIVIAGTVKAVSQRGSLVVMDIEPFDITDRITVALPSPSRGGIGKNDYIAVMGKIVENPQENLKGYDDDASTVIWAPIVKKVPASAFQQ